MEEKQLLLKSTEKVETYARRWWILTIFSLSCFVQAVIWNTWGPIAQSAKVIFSWDNGQIGMLPNWGNIGFIATVMIASYFMDEKGLRISVVVCSGLIFAGAGIRCITSIPRYATWLMNIAAILNGIAGTVFFAGPALVAAVWFPIDQRATATAISSFFNYAGIAGAFVIGPQLVSAPEYNTSLYRDVMEGTTSVDIVTKQSQNLTHPTNFLKLQREIMNLMFYECIGAGVLFIATIIYFPDKPPTPPSYTASVRRVEYSKAFGNILKSVPVWLISIAYALPMGVYGVWGTVIDLIIDPAYASQTEIGWIGFLATMAGCLGSLFIARFSDMFMKHMKLFLVCLFLGGGGSYLWFTLICTKTIQFSTVQLYTSCILGGVFLNGGIPLFYELACEASYPVSEGITGAFITLLDNLFGVIFLLPLQIPHLGTAWMNWTLLGSIVVGLIFMIAFPESYGRTNLDMSINVPVPSKSKDIQQNTKENDVE